MTLSARANPGGGWSVDSVLVDLHLKSTILGEFAISKNWLSLREAVPPGSASPQMSEHQNIENIRQG